MRYPQPSSAAGCGPFLAVLAAAAFALATGVGALLLCADWLQRNQPVLAWPA